jgi:glutathione-regulated potassium-efflux system ancillary protein KefG
MKTLILFAHPRLEKSKINRALLSRIPRHADLTFHDLYETYPDFNIDIEREKELLLRHDLIIWQHPFYWYSCPPLLKQWIDLVLEFEWAYGPGGNALQGKIIFNSITTGGAAEAYEHEGRNRFTVREFLAPFDQTAHLCKMIYLPPFVIQGTHRLTDDKLQQGLNQYEKLLKLALDDKLDTNAARNLQFLNQAVEPINL